MAYFNTFGITRILDISNESTLFQTDPYELAEKQQLDFDIKLSRDGYSRYFVPLLLLVTTAISERAIYTAV
jgi:hypothetical protein